MTLPEPAAHRKPRRLGLYAPFALAGVAVLAWCAAWFWLAGEVGRRMDAARDHLIRQGWRVTWTHRSLSGFPFRLDVDLAGVSIREPTGWAVATPRLKAEAWAYAPDHWIIVAPDPLDVARREGGRLTLTARALRASLSDFAAAPPRLSVEGEGLTFQPAPGAAPFALTSAKELHLHTRAGPSDQGAARLEVDGATVTTPGLLGQIAAGKPVDLVIDGIYDHARAFAGPDWPTAARAWRDAGGAFTVRGLRIAAGDTALDARSGALAIDAHGRLQGALPVTIGQPTRALTALREAGAITDEAARAAATVLSATGAGPHAAITLDFQAGRTTLGPVALGPAPRIF
jgi:hypothetical protein